MKQSLYLVKNFESFSNPLSTSMSKESGKQKTYYISVHHLAFGFLSVGLHHHHLKLFFSKPSL